MRKDKQDLYFIHSKSACYQVLQGQNQVLQT